MWAWRISRKFLPFGVIQGCRTHPAAMPIVLLGLIAPLFVRAFHAKRRAGCLDIHAVGAWLILSRCPDIVWRALHNQCVCSRNQESTALYSTRSTVLVVLVQLLARLVLLFLLWDLSLCVEFRIHSLRCHIACTHCVRGKTMAGLLPDQQGEMLSPCRSQIAHRMV